MNITCIVLLLLLDCINCMKSVVLILNRSCVVGWAIIFLLIFAVEDHHSLTRSIDERTMNEGMNVVEVASRFSILPYDVLSRSSAAANKRLALYE